MVKLVIDMNSEELNPPAEINKIIIKGDALTYNSYDKFPKLPPLEFASREKGVFYYIARLFLYAIVSLPFAILYTIR